MQWRPKKAAKGKAKPTQPKTQRRPTPLPAQQPESTQSHRSRARPDKTARPTRQASDDGDKGESARKKAKLSRLYKPEGMSLEDWQIELRRQYGREQNFQIENRGEHPLFSEFQVANPQSQGTYTVHIRGHRIGENHCSCPDFATNTLGTCKHIEHTLAVLEQKPGAVAKLRAGYQPPYSEVYLQYGAQREVRFRPGSACPFALARLAAGYFGADGALLPDAFGRFEAFLSQGRTLEPELRCFDDVLSFVAEVRDAGQRTQRIAQECPRGIRSAVFRDLLKVSLYDYQREGVLFAARAGRCLIGDEMGLGKTIQALATAELMARFFGVERVLIVCPTSLKHQWQREIERCCDRSCEVMDGLRHRREKLYATDTFFKVANYDTVYRDLEFIQRWSPDLVILDEAQRIKNWTTRTARSVKRIVSPYAIVLTGTPLENRLEELISIVQFVDRFRLGPTFRLLHEHQIRDNDGKVVGYQKLDQIGKTLEPILVRRHKDEVLDQLPERIDSNIFVPMEKLQLEYHNENREIVARIVHKWRRLRFLSEADKNRLMIALQRMRMSCDNSYLVDHRSDAGRKADEAVTLLDEMFEQPDAKVVIFSQWLRMLELIQRRVEGKPWEHVNFHGGLSSNKRMEAIDRFRNDPKCRVFLGTDAGGVGLNLQHANVVINMDVPWNPAVLEQRIGRVHRLGQRQPVRVINFVAQGTIEEGMLSVIKFKKSLFEGVLDGGEKEVFLGGSRLNKFMETVESATAAIPEAMMEDAEDALRAPPGETAGPEPMSTGTGKRRRKVAAAVVPAGVGGDSEDEAPQRPAANDPWSGLIQTGMALLQQFAGVAPVGNAHAASKSGPPTPAGPSIQGLPRVARDEKTGESYVRLPMPSPQVVEQVLETIGALLRGFRS
jgi:superfamily II DNA or RNA helicase